MCSWSRRRMWMMTLWPQTLWVLRPTTPPTAPTHRSVCFKLYLNTNTNVSMHQTSFKTAVACFSFICKNIFQFYFTLPQLPNLNISIILHFPESLSITMAGVCVCSGAGASAGGAAAQRGAEEPRPNHRTAHTETGLCLSALCSFSL